MLVSVGWITFGVALLALILVTGFPFPWLDGVIFGPLLGLIAVASIVFGVARLRRSLTHNRKREQRYEIRYGSNVFSGLSANEALMKVRELLTRGVDPFLYDELGDPMSLVELEEVAARSRQPSPPYPESRPSGRR